MQTERNSVSEKRMSQSVDSEITFVSVLLIPVDIKDVNFCNDIGDVVGVGMSAVAVGIAADVKYSNSIQFSC